MVVYCNIYSTFLQRAYDQLIHDVCLQNLPIIFCLDRAGIVGEDGATHHGIFDLAYLRCIPNLIIAAPSNEIELRNLLYTVQKKLEHPIAIRYPRGRGQIVDWEKSFSEIKIGEGRKLKSGSEIAVLSVGNMAYNVTEAINAISEKEQLGHYDLRFVKPLDHDLLHQVFRQYNKIVTVEDGVVKGGFGGAIAEFASENNYKNLIKIIGIGDYFPEHGSVEQLQEQAGLSPEKIREVIISLL